MSVPKIFVGDPHQQIYAFRGAVNALDLIRTTKTFYLTRSFRFGPEIAYLANCWLEGVKGVQNKMLFGSQKVACLDGTVTPEDGPVTIIARKNETIFEYCVQFVVKQEPPKKIHIVGGYGKLNDILAIYWLMLPPDMKFARREEIHSDLLTRFDDFDTFVRTTSKSCDKSYEAATRIALRYLDRVPGLVKQIKENHVDMWSAERILTTVHKSKGLEFNVVQLADDFPTLSDLRGASDIWCLVAACADDLISPVAASGSKKEDDYNLLYVAMTRAKKSLIMNRAVYEFMRSEMRECFEIPLAAKEVMNKKLSASDLSCLVCENSLASLAHDDFVLFRKSIAVTRNMKTGILRPGVLCHGCASEKGGVQYRFLEANTGEEVYKKDGVGTNLLTSEDYTRRLMVFLFSDSENQ